MKRIWPFMISLMLVLTFFIGFASAGEKVDALILGSVVLISDTGDGASSERDIDNDTDADDDQDADMDEDEDSDADEDKDDDKDIDEDKDKPGEDKDEDENKEKIEYVTEDGYNVEIKDGKIEIKGNGTTFELKDGKVEYKSESGKLEIKPGNIEVKGDIMEEFKQKLDVYQAIIDMGIEVGGGFSDVESSWAKSTIEKMSAIRVFNGYEDGTFKPDNSISQAEVIVLVDRITPDDEEDEDEEKDKDEDEFAEIPGWAKESVQEAAYKGVINLNRFHSHVQASRTQVAVIIAKSLELQPVDASSIPFKDGILISPEDTGYILALYQKGIIIGNPDGKFNPNSAITRAEMAIIMERIIIGQ